MSKEQLLSLMKATGNNAKKEEYKQCLFATKEKEELFNILSSVGKRMDQKKKAILDVIIILDIN